MKIELQGICKSFDGKKRVLDEVCHCFESGKTYVIKGISGSGKTTLLNILSGLAEADSGRVEVSPDATLRIGYVFQQSHLLSGISVYDNLKLIRNDEEAIRKYAKKLGVDELLERNPEHLSGGQRQRIAIIRALITNPQLVIADEPSASLDPENSKTLAQIMEQLRGEDRIVVIATHEGCFDAIADEILDLSEGRVSVRKGGRDVPVKALEEELIRDNPALLQRGRKSFLNTFQNDARIIFRRRFKGRKILRVLPFALILFLVLVVSAIHANIATVMVEEYRNLYPLDVVELSASFDERRLPEGMLVYHNYVARDKDITGYYLMPEEYSAFRLPGMVAEGHFPQGEDEILVTPKLAKHLDEAKDLVGAQVELFGRSFTVAGITGDLFGDTALVEYRRMDAYYRYNFNEVSALIPYETIAEFGQIEPTYSGMYVLPGLGEDPTMQDKIKSLDNHTDTISFFYYDMVKAEERAGNFAKYVAIVSGLLLLFGSVFIVAIIRCELINRSRELGYLRIFGLSIRRIKALIGREYRFSFLLSLFAAIVAYLIVAFVAFIVFGMFFLPKIQFVLIVVIAALFIWTIQVHIGMKKIIKMRPLELI